MPVLLKSPTIVEAAGSPPKRIAEHVGRLATSDAGVSVALMESPPGWCEPGQRPEFDEYSIVLDGVLRVEHEGGTLDVAEGQSVHALPGEWVRYSTPVGARYVAVCLPAFSPEGVHRDRGEQA